jgi:hypothetical protein
VMKGLGLVPALLTAFAVTAPASATTHASATTKTIATASSTDFRADLVAQRASDGSAPTATVTLTTYRHAADGWQRIGSKRIAGTYFWNTVTGPRAICRFELASASHAHVAAQLLVSPSVGCGKAVTIGLPVR